MGIDFVVLWVDGNDEEWLLEKDRYSPSKNTDTGLNRYRDLENLQYWFRGVEKFAPWVRKIHFVTWGHLPEWLDVSNPKLNIVKHVDFIPSQFLPTFNSNTIELNIHRIKDLSENFVYFNDDMYLVRNVSESDFFKNNLPCDICVLDSITPTELFSHILVNNFEIINKRFEKKAVVRTNISKWFNLKYGPQLYRTIVLLPWKMITGLKDPHLPISFKKSTFLEVWQKEEETLNNTCKNKFRSAEDVNAWLFRYWQLLKGDFYPSKQKGAHLDIFSVNDIIRIQKSFSNSRNKMLCLNDAIVEKDYDKVKSSLISFFNDILPNKSSFEK